MTEEEFQNEDAILDEDEDYINQKEIAGGNIKDDPASVRSRPRHLPVSKLELKDEDLIPKMPEKILPMPLTQEEYDKKRKEYIEKIKKKNDSIKELVEKRKMESLGMKGTKDNIFNRMNELKAEIRQIKEELKNEDKINETTNFRNDIKYYKGEVDKYNKMHFPQGIKAVEEEIKNLKESLSFSELTAQEEKQIHDKKNNLEEYLKALKSLKDLKDQYKEPIKKTGELRKKLADKKKELDGIYKTLDEANKKKEENNPKINQINLHIELLKKEKEDIRKELSDFTVDQTNKWKEYNEQQGLIDYIERARARIKALKAKQNKLEKKANAEKKENQQAEIETKKVVKKIYDTEIKNCDYLLNYFSKIQPKEEEVKQETNAARENSKLDEDLSKGKLKVIKRDEEGFGCSGPEKKKKKGKKPKTSKRNDKETIGFELDIQMLNTISSLGLAAPSSKDDIKEFIKKIEDKKAEYEKNNKEEVEEPKNKEKEEVEDSKE